MALPDYEAWALFDAVATHGSFRGAAKATGLSVPTVSKAVHRLEAALGVALFHRTSRSVTLSAAGERLSFQARAMVVAAAQAEEAARIDAQTLAGPIRMTAPLSLGLCSIGAPIAEFLSAHPAVTIDCMLSDAQCDLVANGHDLAIRIGELSDSSLLAQSIAPVPASLLASPAYLDRYGEPQHPRDLEHHRLLGYGHENRRAPVRLVGPGKETVSVQPRGPLFVNNGELMLPLLVAGEGLAMLPHFIAREALRAGRLVPVMPDWQPPPLTLHLLTPPSRLRPARVGALARFLVDRLRNDEAFAARLAESG